MALTSTQMAALNRLLQQYPTSPSHPNLLAEMFVLMPVGVRTEWKNDVLAKIAAAQTADDSVYSDATSLINQT